MFVFEVSVECRHKVPLEAPCFPAVSRVSLFCLLEESVSFFIWCFKVPLTYGLSLDFIVVVLFGIDL